VDRAVIKDKETHKYCLRSTGGDIRVMLVWYDPPAAISTGDGSSSTLINDLDLAVTSAGMGGQTLLGNHGQVKDSRNTAERVWLRNVPAGGLEISVSAAINVPDGTPQNYSLVVQGAFAGELASPFNPDAAAKAATPGGCPAQQMQSAPTPAAATDAGVSPAAAPANVTAADTIKESAVAAGAVDMSAARAQDPTAATAAASLAAGDAAAGSPSPAADAVQASPSPSPGVDSSALVDMLVSTMTAPAASPVPSPAGRRLTWMPSPPPAMTVRVPARICEWLTAAGLAPEHNFAQDSDRVMAVPLGAVVVVGSCVLLALLALIVSPSMRRYGIGRSASLTSALREDLTKNSCMASRKQRGKDGKDGPLLEHLLPADGLDAAAAAAAAPGGASRSSSRSLKHANSSSLNSGSPSSSGNSSSEPSTPTSPTRLRCKSQCGSSPNRQGSLPPTWPGSNLLPSAASCPGAFAYASAAQPVDAAAITVPEYADATEHCGGSSSSSFSFSHMLEGAAAPAAAAAGSFVGRPYSRSFSCSGGPAQQHAALPPWLVMMSASPDVQQQRQQQQQGQAVCRISSASSTHGLPPQMPGQQQQQRGGALIQDRIAPMLSPHPAAAAAAERPVRRSSSFTLALGSKQLQQQQQQQQVEVVSAGLLIYPDAQMPRDQQHIARS
jgi:hypothetical protein